MAKKKNKGFIKCVNYRLELTNDGNGPSFDLSVDGDDDATYNLIIRIVGDREELVRAILSKLASVWHQREFEFRVDDNNEISEIR